MVTAPLARSPRHSWIVWRRSLAGAAGSSRVGTAPAGCSREVVVSTYDSSGSSAPQGLPLGRLLDSATGRNLIAPHGDVCGGCWRPWLRVSGRVHRVTS
jgi:hypothetical protein